MNNTTSYSALLLSNSDVQREFPQNKPSKFTTKLLEPWQLGDGWEACITDISYPMTWANQTQELSFQYRCFAIDGAQNQLFRVTIQPGYYHGPEKVVDLINEQIESQIVSAHLHSSALRFYYDAFNDVVKYQTNGTCVLFYVPRQRSLMAHLGIAPDERADLIGQIQGLVASDPNLLTKIQELLMSVGFNQDMILIFDGEKRYGAPSANKYKVFNYMHVYSDLVHYSNIGSTMAPHMGVVAVNEAKFGSQVVTIFPYQDWIPVNKTIVSTIEIKLANEFGEEIAFKYGSVAIRLKLRRKRMIV